MASSKRKQDSSGSGTCSKLCTKKLRCGDPDLKVILKYTDQEDNESKEKVYDMYGPVLAGMSNFFDTALSVEMKEKSTREIILPDVTPDLFENALKFQQDGSSIRSMTVEDALDVVEFYNMYEFRNGLHLCDDILLEYFKEKNEDEPMEFDELVNFAHKVHKNNLPKSVQEVAPALNQHLEQNPFSAARMTTEQIEMLIPLFKEYPSVLPKGFSPEDSQCPFFPKYFRKSMTLNVFAQKKCPDLKLVFEDDQKRVYRTFKANEDGWKSDFGVNSLHIRREHDDGWVIHDRDWGVVDLKSHCGKHMDLPPLGPWRRVDDGTSFLLLVDNGAKE